MVIFSPISTLNSKINVHSSTINPNGDSVNIYFRSGGINRLPLVCYFSYGTSISMATMYTINLNTLTSTPYVLTAHDFVGDTSNDIGCAAINDGDGVYRIKITNKSATTVCGYMVQIGGMAYFT